VQGHFDDAIAHYEEAGRVTRAASGEKHLLMADVHAGVAYALASLGRCSEASARAHRALELEQVAQDAELPARAHYSLALCLSPDGKASTTREALEHAHKAGQALREAPPGLMLKSPTAQTLKAQVEAWLARHPG
jgi:hypothetical protein